MTTALNTSMLPRRNKKVVVILIISLGAAFPLVNFWLRTPVLHELYLNDVSGVSDVSGVKITPTKFRRENTPYALNESAPFNKHSDSAGIHSGEGTTEADNASSSIAHLRKFQSTTAANYSDGEFKDISDTDADFDDFIDVVDTDIDQEGNNIEDGKDIHDEGEDYTVDNDEEENDTSAVYQEEDVSDLDQDIYDIYHGEDMSDFDREEDISDPDHEEDMANIDQDGKDLEQTRITDKNLDEKSLIDIHQSVQKNADVDRRENDLHSDVYQERYNKDNHAAAPNLEKFYKYLKKREFVESSNRTIFIFGAVVRSSSAVAQCNVYGQSLDVVLDYQEAGKVTCCLKHNTSTIIQTRVTYFGRTWHNNKNTIHLQPWFFTCPLPFSHAPLRLISVVHGSNKCTDDSTIFIEPFYAMKMPPGYLVISTKVAHEKLDPVLLITQFETLRYVGVDKVITYAENTLWDDAKAVLGYYASLGFVELYSFTMADMARYPRRLAEQEHQIYADQTTVMRDSVERSSGATYFGIFDNDEFPIPSDSRSLKETLDSMGQRYPSAASFVFRNQHFFTDVLNTTCTEPCMFFRRHMYTPPGKLNLIHRKVISYPSRIYTGTLFSHRAKPLKGYTEVECPEAEAFVRHYGSCDSKFKVGLCSNSDAWVYNATVVDWAEKTVAGRIERTIKLLL